ncbi:hypothetical protein BSONL12_09657 [Bacillus sonorensis L12]|uniref:Uncharacterized protein n=1 Tax=Bacillus sonorensis L12 TaxID=1274524 RepID=M5P721_9BACI|nr:hypothetical protein BSONL12_09657 [Bacillus sonorensis L12]
MCKGEPESIRYVNEVRSKACFAFLKKGGTAGHNSSLSYREGLFLLSINKFVQIKGGNEKHAGTAETA